LRLHQIKHQLRGDCRIHRAAAVAQHFARGRGREGMGGHNHLPLCPNGKLCLPPGGGFGLGAGGRQRTLRGRIKRSQQRPRHEQGREGEA